MTVSDYSFIFIDFLFEFKNAVMENAVYKNQSQTENLFDRVFKKFLGATPGEYRRKNFLLQ